MRMTGSDLWRLAGAMATLLVAGCADEVSTGGGEVGGVHGWVCLGPYGSPSAGARVTVQSPSGASQSAEADETGEFAVDEVEVGEAWVVISNRVEQRAERVRITAGGTAQIGVACSYQPGEVLVRLCVDGSLLPEEGTTVALEYLEFGGAHVSPAYGATDSAGEIRFSSVTPGRYRITANTFAEPAVVDVQSGAAVTYGDPGCFDPTTVGSISGRVCNPIGGSPVEGVPVTLSIAGEPDRDATTDANGRFRFDAVPPGRHTVTISPPLQAPAEIDVDVNAGETTVLPSSCTTIDTGVVSGVICESAGGGPLAGVSVRLDVTNEVARYASTNAGGYFRFADVPAGSHTLTVQTTVPRAVPVTVTASEETRIPVVDCDAGLFGRVTGRVCNPADEQPVEDVPVDLEVTGETSPRSTVTDANGEFAFDLVPPGDQTVVIRPPLQAPISQAASVAAGGEYQVPSPTCGTGPLPDPATLTGTACVGITSAHPLPGATIEADFSPGLRVAVAGVDGSFTLDDLPAGLADVTISRGSWSTTFQVTLVANETLDIGMDHCAGPGTRVAVVVGPYDDLISPFSDLGLPVRQDESGTLVDPNGVVDLYDGANDNPSTPTSTPWVRELASSPANLAPYDMVIFASGIGLHDIFATNPCGLPPSNDPGCASMPGVVALESIEAYLDGGGAVYVSDWAYEIVRRQFPQYVNFYANDFMQLKALCGSAPLSANATVLDENLALVLGGATATIEYEALYSYFAVIDSATAQPNGYLVPFLVADVPAYEYINLTDDYCDNSQATVITNSPLIVATPVGTGGGRLVFSNFRYLNAGDNTDIIRQIMLEL